MVRILAEKRCRRLKISRHIKKRRLTVEIGTAQGSKIRLAQGGFKKDHANQDVITSLNGQSLIQLAEIAGGSYFEINENVNESEHLINKINSIEGVVRDIRKID